jgi:hypothetical protein
MVRKISKRMFFVALVITVIVFVGGVYTGWVISKQKISSLESSLGEAEENFEEYKISMELQESLTKGSCEVLSYRNRQVVSDISYLQERLRKYDETKKIEHPEEFKDVRKDYTLLYLRYWLQMRKFGQECDSNNITTILFLFSDKDCKACEGQGKVLEYWKERYEESLLIFPITTDLDLDPVEIIKRSYGVDELPALIVNWNKTYEGFQSKDKIGEIVASHG